jgi:hypothetical protein
MAYPTIDKPYGLKPVNLQGGRVYSGSTRMFPISTGFATSLFNGDVVGNATGLLAATGYGTGAAGAAAGRGVGVFVGCEYSSAAGPIYGKNRYQYWAGGTAAQDAVGYVVDDPLAYFRVAVIAQGTSLVNTNQTIGYMNPYYVGSNVYLVAGTAGNVNTGDSYMGVSSAAVTSGTAGSGVPLTSTAAPFRVIQVVPDTAYTYVTTATSTTSSGSSVTISAADANIKPGMQFIAINANGTYVTGCAPGNYSTVTNANTTTLTITGTVGASLSGATLTFIGYPEVIVGWGPGFHSYNAANGV